MVGDCSTGGSNVSPVVVIEVVVVVVAVKITYGGAPPPMHAFTSVFIAGFTYDLGTSSSTHTAA